MPTPSEVTPIRAVVCVPARNEAQRIGRLLASLSTQSVASEATPLRVVVACNNSTDTTAEIVRGFDAEPRLAIRLLDVVFAPEVAHAGSARRFAMDAGADWLATDGIADGVLISTDADAIAPPTWVAANLVALAHSELVGGRLEIDRDEVASATFLDLNRRIERYWAAVRALEDVLDPPAHDPAPRHGDHTGASLALRASLYRQIGGVPLLASGEDNALVSAVVRSGGRVRHCPDVGIEVSARETGRASGGMANEMIRRRQILAGNAPYLLPSAAFWRAHFERRAAWRAEWSLAHNDVPNAIAHVASCEAGAMSIPVVHVPVEEATADLDAMVASSFVVV